MIRSPSISDATGRTVDHLDVTVAAKPKARDDEPWLIATRNKKLRFAFAFAPRTEPLSLLSRALMYLFRSGNSRELPLHHALDDARTHARASGSHGRTPSSARIFISALAKESVCRLHYVRSLTLPWVTQVFSITKNTVASPEKSRRQAERNTSRLQSKFDKYNRSILE